MKRKSPQTRKLNKLMNKERKKLLTGKGAYREAKELLEVEAAEDFYSDYKPKNRQRKKREFSSHGAVLDWADATAEMMYNRKYKRKRD